MKKQTMSMFIILLMAFLFACSVDEEIKPDQVSVSDGLKCGHPNETVVKVLPNGTDDTQAFIDAFEQAKAAGPGTTVQLVKGTYTIGMVTIHEFFGNFAGAGKGKTIITNLPELPCDSVFILDQSPALIKFIGGEIAMKNMTIQFQDGCPCAPGPINESWYTDLCSGVLFGDFATDFMPAKRFIKASIENVDFLGGIDGGIGAYGTIGNVAMMIYCGGDFVNPSDVNPYTFGEFYVKGCNFKNSMCGFDAFGFDKSIINVENCSFDGGSQNIFMAAILDSKVIIKNNLFTNNTWLDVFLVDWEYGYFPYLNPSKRSEFSFIGNTFNIPAGMSSLHLGESRRILYPDENKPMFISVKNNTFISRDGAPVIIGQTNKDLQIWNNKFSGTGTVGILLNGDSATSTYEENDRIFGNNFSAANYTEANVILGEFTKNCKVIGGGNNNGSVIDLGVNNSVTSFKMKQKGGHWNYHQPKMRQEHNLHQLHR